MEIIQRYLQSKVVLLVVIGILFMTNLFSFCYFIHYRPEKEECICEECPTLVKEEEEKETIKIKVDIKGYVKKPGVYELDSGAILNDLIKLAGGLKSNGTTDNINLSKKLNDEDMVVVLSKTEWNKQKTSTTTTSSSSASLNSSSSTATSNEKQENPVSSEVNNANKKVSLNTATKEELMSLNGIGESKAIAIIEYRTKTPFQDITEIKNVSGIGESIYEKIKDFITI